MNCRDLQPLINPALVYLTVAFAVSFLFAGQSSDAAETTGGLTPSSIAITAQPHALPFDVHSTFVDGTASGEITARLNFPFAAVSAALANPRTWCEFVTLHVNVKGCVYQHKVPDNTSGDNENTGDHVIIYSGHKEFQTLAAAFALDYDFAVSIQNVNEVDVTLSAAHGPIGTRDYVIKVAVRKISDIQTELNIAYHYHTSKLARLSMDTYLATAGSHKVGFTVTRQDVEGHPVYIAGERGVMERNAMRYYLAIQAYLEGARLPANERIEWSSSRWFDLTEQYPLQLHEIAREDYLANKRREFLQQTAN